MKKISRAHLILFSSLVATMVIQRLLILLGVVNNGTLMLIGQCILLIVPLVFMVLWKEDIPKAIRLKKTHPMSFVIAIGAVAVSFPVISFLNLLSMLFVKNALTDAMASLQQTGFLVMFLTIAILPPISEEILCRGVLYNTYSRRRPLTGVFLSAVLFSLFHMNLNQIPYALFVGIVFAFMLEGSDSILVTMVMHFAINGYSTVVNFLSAGSGAVDTAGQMELLEMYAKQPAMLQMTLGIMGFQALICCAILIGLIYGMFKINGRDFRQIYGKHAKNFTIDPKRESFADPWLFGFIGLTVLVTVLNYVVARV